MHAKPASVFSNAGEKKRTLGRCSILSTLLLVAVYAISLTVAQHFDSLSLSGFIDSFPDKISIHPVHIVVAFLLVCTTIGNFLSGILGIFWGALLGTLLGFFISIVLFTAIADIVLD